MEMNKKCLLLGGGGFIGSSLCEKLINIGYKVTVFEKRGFNRNNISHLSGKIEIVEGDINNESLISNLLNKAYLIFYLMCTTIPDVSNKDMLFDISTNILPAVKLFDKIKETDKKIIFFSSGGTVYGVPKSIPVKVDHSTNPVCSYGIHKLTIEKYLYLYNYLYGLDYRIVRISNPYGFHQDPHKPQGAIAVFTYNALKNLPVSIWGDGEVVRDYIYIEDVVDAIIKTVNYERGERIFNIGSGKGISLNEIINEIKNNISSEINVHYESSRKFDIKKNVLDIEMTKKELNWEPNTDIKAGIKLMIDNIKKYIRIEK